MSPTNLNRVEIAGGLTRDPELKYLPSGTPLVELAIALNGTRYDREAGQQVVKTTYVTAVVWGQRAEELCEWLSRGDVVYCLGEWDQTEYEKRDGTKERKTRLEVAVCHVVKQRRKAGRPPSEWAKPVSERSQSEDPWASVPPPEDPPF